jgi:hypothetical protein
MYWAGKSKWFLLASAILFAGWVGYLVFRPVPQGTQTRAVVLTIGANPSGRLSRGSVTIVAQSTEGRIGQAVVRLGQLRCRVGDRINARNVGISLRIDPATCTRPQ